MMSVLFLGVRMRVKAPFNAFVTMPWRGGRREEGGGRREEGGGRREEEEGGGTRSVRWLYTAEYTHTGDQWISVKVSFSLSLVLPLFSFFYFFAFFFVVVHGGA
jgi:hypothetical protein